MADVRPNSPDQNEAVTMEIGQEVRFAVVLYGGISLAIYINGVAQELLHLVRATAPHPDDKTKPFLPTVNGTEAVYRKVGQLLGRKAFDAGQPWSPNDPIRTRFVVDILSGTSAGGINGIYLAKALANNESMDELQSLWIEKGDIAKLLNDGKELDRKFHQSPPASLLSGWYMYDELLRAFEQMKPKKDEPPVSASPYVDDLDLFVTTTDIRGLPFPLRLWDKVADERRHRNVFKFRYSDGQASDECNDFRDNNALLAFAARCTSAFPYAFEPVSASDAVNHHRLPLFPNVKPGGEHPWDAYFPMYKAPPGTLPEEESKYRWTERAFGDGGYLDNKPFSYAIETLASRRATVAVDRKLLYVEPDPEQLEFTPGEDGDKPNVIENVNAALSLARYETIREDLGRILERNSLIDRVQRILTGMENDIPPSDRLQQDLPRPRFRETTLQKQIEERGPSYGGYHRLKLAAASDDVTEMIARVAGFDADSDLFDAIRHLVRVWRKMHYTENGENGCPTEFEFLVKYDLDYRQRRLNFVLGKIDVLFCLNDETAALLNRWGEQMPAEAEDRTAFRTELRRLCHGLGTVHRSLRRARATIVQNTAIRDAIARTGLDGQALRRILDAESEDERTTLLCEMMADPRLDAAFDALDAAVAAHIGAATKSASAECEKLLNGPDQLTGEHDAAALARRIVRAYYANYEQYDLIAFPILYSTAVGNEMDPVEVVRVSPQDARVNPQGERKLGGTAYGHFGAFLKEGWRRNDILWGRMHGAERLITVLLRGTGVPDSVRNELIAEAHRAILSETFAAKDSNQLCGLLIDALAIAARDDVVPRQLYDLLMKESGAADRERAVAALRAGLEPDQLYAFFKDEYKVDPDLDRAAMTKTLGRATRVTGQMLSHVANEANLPNKPAVWLARMGSGITALLELAVPTRVWGDIGRRLLAFCVFIGLFLALTGWIAANDPIEHYGVLIAIATVTVSLAAYILGDFVSRRGRWRMVLRGASAVLAAILIGFAIIGVLHAGDASRTALHWLQLQTGPAASAIASSAAP